MVKPVYEFMGEFFELERRGWVQRQIGWIATHVLQFLKQKIKNDYHTALSKVAQEENVASIIDSIAELIWPSKNFVYIPWFNLMIFSGGKLFVPQDPPSPEQIIQIFKEAESAIPTLIPDSLKTIIGEEFVELRFLKLHRLFQQELLVKHLAYALLEKLIFVLIRKPSKIYSKLKSNPIG
jgi:hypothetical protein